MISDLQLAAELGKTLLERNKELESALKNHQNIIEDQSQEIEVSFDEYFNTLKHIENLTRDSVSVSDQTNFSSQGS